MSKKIKKIGLIIILMAMFYAITSTVKATDERAFELLVNALQVPVTKGTGTIGDDGVQGDKLLSSGSIVETGGRGAWASFAWGKDSNGNTVYADIYCVQDGGKITGTNGGLNSYNEGKKYGPTTSTLSDMKQKGERKNEIYKVQKTINMADTTNTYTYNGETRHFQDLAYILSSKATEETKQDAIWMTKYNLSNGGKKYGKADDDDDTIDKSGFEYSNDIIENTLTLVENVVTNDDKHIIKQNLDKIIEEYAPDRYYMASSEEDNQCRYYNYKNDEYEGISGLKYWSLIYGKLFYSSKNIYKIPNSASTIEDAIRVDSLQEGAELRKYIEELNDKNEGTDLNAMYNRVWNILNYIIAIDDEINKDESGKYTNEQSVDKNGNITELVIEKWVNNEFGNSYSNYLSYTINGKKKTISRMELTALTTIYGIAKEYNENIYNMPDITLMDGTTESTGKLNRDQLVERLEKVIEVQDALFKPNNDGKNLIEQAYDVDNSMIYSDEDLDEVNEQKSKFIELRDTAESKGETELVEFYNSYIEMADLIQKASNNNVSQIRENAIEWLKDTLKKMKDNLNSTYQTRIDSVLNKEDVTVEELIRLFRQIREFNQENYFNSLVEKYFNLKKEADAYYNFYNEFHDKVIDQEGNEIEKGKNTTLDKSKAKVYIDQEEQKYKIGPFKINYMYNYIEKSCADGKSVELSVINKITIKDKFGKEITNATLTGFDNGNYKYPKSGEEFYVEFNNSNQQYSASEISIDVKFSALVQCGGYIAVLKDNTYQHYWETIWSHSDSNTGITSYKYILRRSDATQESQKLILVLNDINFPNVDKIPDTYGAYRYYETFGIHETIDIDKDTLTWQLTLQKENETGDVLSGAKFKIFVYNEKGKELDSFEEITDTSGQITLPVFDYTGQIKILAKEIQAPKGYKLDSTNHEIELEVEKDPDTSKLKINTKHIKVDGDNVKVYNSEEIPRVILRIKNEKDTPPPPGTTPSTYKLEIVKLSDKYENLDGAEFYVTLENDKGDRQSFTDTTWDGGILTIPNLKITGDVTLTIHENEPPEGYKKIEQDIVIKYHATKSGSKYYIDSKEFDTIDNDNIANEYIHKIVIRDGGNSASIYIKNEKENEPTLKTTMNLGGYTFIDGGNGKANNANGVLDVKDKEKLIRYMNGEDVSDIDAVIEGSDALTSGVEVILRSTDKTVEKRTVSEKGKYIFTNLDPMKDYQVEFIYNGQAYEGITPQSSEYNSDAWATTSKGLEDASARKTLNNSTFSEIGSDPVAYVSGNALGYLPTLDGNKGKATYNRAYPQEDLSDVYALIQDEAIKNKGMDTIELYKKIARENSDIAEIQNKLQFIYDCRISAYTKDEDAEVLIKNGTNNKTDYPVYDKFVIDDGIATITYPNGSNKQIELKDGYDYVSVDETSQIVYVLNGENYPVIYPGQYFINMGIKARPEFDLTMTEKTVMNATVEINGKTETYTYNGEEGIVVDNKDIEASKSLDVAKQLAVRNEDIEASKGEASTTPYKLTGDDKLQIYVKYGIRIVNETDVIGSVTEVVDYIDNRFEFDSAIYKKSGEDKEYEVNKTDDIYKSMYGSTSHSKTHDYREDNNGYLAGYTPVYIPITGDIKLEGQESLYVFITLKLKEEVITSGKLQEVFGTDGKGKLQEYNYAEINGYKTYGKKGSQDENTSLGLIDRDSIAGNLNINKYPQMYEQYQDACNKISETDITEINQEKVRLYNEIFEDDNKRAEAFEISKNENARTLTGNVWDATTEDVKNSSNISKDSLSKYIENNGIKNIKVQLVELKNNEEIVRFETMTDKEDEPIKKEDGSYEFTGYIPGNYVVRFIYGDEETIEYNGQDYQSTIANDQTNDATYWYDKDKDKRYSDAYDEVQSRLDAIDYLDQYGYVKGNEINTGVYTDVAKNALTMTANTSTLELEVEYATPSVIGSTSTTPQDRKYEITNVDFGIIKRAESKLTIDKTIESYRIILQNGDELLNSADGMNQKYIKVLPPDENGKMNISMEIDDEILHGAKLEVTYKITVTNEGDPNTITYYFENNDDKIDYENATTITDKIQIAKDKAIAVGYYGEKMENLVQYETKPLTTDTKTILKHYTETETQTQTYIYKENPVQGKTKNVTTKAMNIVDYPLSAFNFDGELTEDNKNWVAIKIGKDGENNVIKTLENNTVAGIDNQPIQVGTDGSTYQTILITGLANELTTTPLISNQIPEEDRDYDEVSERSTTLTLTRELTTSDDLEFDNTVEIVEIENMVGRVDREATPGNLNPTKWDEEWKTYNETPEEDKVVTPAIEHDSSKAALISIVDSTGEDRSNSYYIIAIPIIAIFAVGIVLIKKYVLKK